MAIASLIVSIFAIVISCVSVYLSHLEPFTASITPSDPIWSLETVDKKGNKEVKALVLIVPVAFMNEGAKPGCIDDLRLTLHSYGEAKDTHFFPGLAVDYARFLKGKEKLESVYQHSESTFTPILMPGKKTFTKVFAFFSRDRLVPEDLKEGRYRVDFSYLESGKNSPEQFFSANYILKKKTMESLKKGAACVPLNEQRDKIRGE